MGSEEKIVPLSAGIFLMIVGGCMDLLQMGLDFIVIGIVLDPLIISPITGVIFGITLNHYGISMFSGKRSASGWIALIVEFLPGIDFVPGWFAYAAYLTFAPRVMRSARGIIGGS